MNSIGNKNNPKKKWNKALKKQKKWNEMVLPKGKKWFYQNLTGKNAAIFSDATNTPSMTKIRAKESGIHGNCAGTFFYVF
jgi:hypothetical protein